jgi:hypothetical protein
MTTTAIYAIGGTGAKLLEAVVHLCAAGLPTEQLLLRLVDQDKGNGNMGRVRELIGSYQKIQDWLRRDLAEDLGQLAMFSSRIEVLDEPMNVVPNVGETLASAYGLHESAGQSEDHSDLLMQALFSPKERTATMENGFRGQPAVGAAVFLSYTSRRQSPLWACLREDVTKALDGGISQFLLLGSCFGGTGAAGLPTIAYYLRHALRRANPAVRIGSVMMSRYYGVVGRSDYGPAKLAQIKAALEFYNQVMDVDTRAGRQRLFDSLYLVGSYPEGCVSAEPHGGGEGQVNPALLPELIGALGAVHFLNRLDQSMQARERPVFVCGYSAKEDGTRKESVTWSDLPRTARPNGGDDMCKLASFVRFATCYAYHLHAGKALSSVPHALDQPNYLTLLSPKKLKAGEYDASAGSLNVFVQKFLLWLGALHAAVRETQGRSVSNGIALAAGRVSALVTASAASPDGFVLKYDPADLSGHGSHLLDALEEVFAMTPNGVAPSFSAAQRELARTPPRTRRKPNLGRFVAAAYAATCLPPVKEP